MPITYSGVAPGAETIGPVQIDETADYAWTGTHNYAGATVVGLTAGTSFGDGNAAAPGLTWTADTDLGWYRAGANNQVAVVGGSTVAVDMNATRVTVGAAAGAVTMPLYVQVGSAAAPSLAVVTDTDTGIYRIGANNLGVATAGTLALDIGDVTAADTTVSHLPVTVVPAAATAADAIVVDATNLTVEAAFACNAATLTGGDLFDIDVTTAPITSDAVIFNVTDDRGSSTVGADWRGLGVTLSGTYDTGAHDVRPVDVDMTGLVTNHAAAAAWGAYVNANGTVTLGTMGGAYLTDGTNVVRVCDHVNSLNATGPAAMTLTDVTPTSNADALDLELTNVNFTGSSAIDINVGNGAGGYVGGSSLIDMDFTAATVLAADTTCIDVNCGTNVTLNGAAVDLVGVNVDASAATLTLYNSIYGMSSALPAVFAGTGAAGYFAGDGKTAVLCNTTDAGNFTDGVRTVTVCNGTEAINAAGGAIVGTLLDLIPAANADVLDITMTGATTASAIDIVVSNTIVSGQLVDIALDTAAIIAESDIIRITDSRDHDDLAADAYRGVTVETSGNWPGTNLSRTYLVNAEYSGTTGAAGANAEVYAVRGDISGAVLTAGVTAAGQFVDAVSSATLCDGTNAAAFVGGPVTATTVDLVSGPADALDIDMTGATTQSAIDVLASNNVVSGQLVDIGLDTAAIVADSDIVRVTDSRDHDDLGADAYRGVTVETSGDWPGTNASTTYLLNAEYSGVTGATAGNATVYAVRGDISTATLTAGVTAAGRFSDAATSVTLCDGTAAITATGGAIAGTFLDLTPGADADVVDITGTGLVTAAAIDIDNAARTSGNVVDIALTVSTVGAGTSGGLTVDDSRNVGAAVISDVTEGLFSHAGNVPGGAAQTFDVLKVVKGGITGASGAAAVVNGVYVDLTGVTRTAGTTRAAYFEDPAMSVALLNGTNAVAVNGNTSLTTLDSTPGANVDAIDITGTGMTTADAIDITMAAKTGGTVVLAVLGTSAIEADGGIFAVSDSRDHDDLGADTHVGYHIAASGDWPGTNASNSYLVNAEYSGITGAAGANATVYAVRGDVSGATMTAGTTAAGYFSDGVNTVTLCDGTNAIGYTGTFGMATADLTPTTNIDALDIDLTNNNFTTASAIDIDAGDITGGNMIDIQFTEASTLTTDTNIIRIDANSLITVNTATVDLHGIDIDFSTVVDTDFATFYGMDVAMPAAYQGTDPTSAIRATGNGDTVEICHEGDYGIEIDCAAGHTGLLSTMAAVTDIGLQTNAVMDTDTLFVGGGFGVTGVTITNTGNIRADGSLDVGGGYGATGMTVSNTGTLQTDGNITAGNFPAVKWLSKSARDYVIDQATLVNVTTADDWEAAVSGGMPCTTFTVSGAAPVIDQVFTFTVPSDFVSWPGNATGATADLQIWWAATTDAAGNDAMIQDVMVYDAPADVAAAPNFTVVNVTDRAGGRIDGTTDGSRGYPTAVDAPYRATDSIAAGTWTRGQPFRVVIRVFDAATSDIGDVVKIFKVALRYNAA